MSIDFREKLLKTINHALVIFAEFVDDVIDCFLDLVNLRVQSFESSLDVFFQFGELLFQLVYQFVEVVFLLIDIDVVVLDFHAHL